MNGKNLARYAGIFMVFAVSTIYLFFFLKRFIYPDSAFDTINYHFFLGKNGFDNFPFPFKDAEFFPLGMHGFNPIIEMFNYIAYLFFGFRIGTILSAVSMIGTVILGYFFLIRFFPAVFTSRTAATLLILIGIPAFIVHEALFQVATYFTDNLFVFLLMACLYALFSFRETTVKRKEFFMTLLFGVLVGLIMAKLTNFIYVLPFVCVFIYFLYQKNKVNGQVEFKRITLLIVFFGFIVLLLNSFMIFNFINSGNPVFPYYNSIFKSEYYSNTNWPFNYGPTTLKQRIFYPFYAIWHPTSLGEVKDAFPDRKLLVVFFYVSITVIFSAIKKEKRPRREQIMLMIYFFSFILWQFQFGYSRYGIFLEILGGMIAMISVAKIFTVKERINFEKVISILFVGYMLFQSYSIFLFNEKYDFSWRPTPTLSEWWKAISCGNIFEKYTLLNESDSLEIQNVDVVIQCSNPSSLYFATILQLKDLPMINIDKGSNIVLSEKTEYRQERDGRIFNWNNRISGKNDDVLNIAMVVNESGGPDSGVSEKRCHQAIQRENADGMRIVITKEFLTNNYISDKGFVLKVLLGKYYR